MCRRPRLRVFALLGAAALASSCRTPLPTVVEDDGDASVAASSFDSGLLDLDTGPRCGNGRVDPGEPCDDGNSDEHDGCRNDCTRSRCGDGVVWTSVEECDDGNQVDDDDCRNTCDLPRCGDGLVQSPEQCDDANTDATDDRLPSCLRAFCGDGFVHAGVELCDDANWQTNDACITCKPARCGDGFVQHGVEEIVVVGEEPGLAVTDEEQGAHGEGIPIGEGAEQADKARACIPVGRRESSR